MKTKYGYYLAIAYIWGVALFILTMTLDLYSTYRALFLLVAFLPILIIHITASFSINSWQIRIPFHFLTILWIIKYITLSITEGFYLLLQRGFDPLDWIDLLLFVAILLYVSISFLLKFPFFLERVEQKYIVVIGIMGLIFSLSTAALVGLSLFTK